MIINMCMINMSIAIFHYRMLCYNDCTLYLFRCVTSMTMSVFHSKHGRGVTLVGDGRTARWTGGGGSGVLFSGAPLQSQVVWTIKMEQTYFNVSFIILIY